MEGFKFLLRPVLNGLYVVGDNVNPYAYIFCAAMLSMLVIAFVLDFSLAAERMIAGLFVIGTILFILGAWRFVSVEDREEQEEVDSDGRI